MNSSWWICDFFPEMADQFPGINSVASNPGPKESYSGKREPNWPLIQGFAKYEIVIFLELKV